MLSEYIVRGTLVSVPPVSKWHWSATPAGGFRNRPSLLSFREYAISFTLDAFLTPDDNDPTVVRSNAGWPLVNGRNGWHLRVVGMFWR
jgi:hypothetical protein